MYILQAVQNARTVYKLYNMDDLMRIVLVEIATRCYAFIQ